MKRLSLVILFVAVVLAQRPGPQLPSGTAKVESCGFGGDIHDCHCADRVEKIRAADIGTCSDVKDAKLHDACVRNALAGHAHCDIAERSTHWDVEGDDPYPDLHGDNVKSKMGEYCKRACKPHHCGCGEQSCDFK